MNQKKKEKKEEKLRNLECGSAPLSIAGCMREGKSSFQDVTKMFSFFNQLTLIDLYIRDELPLNPVSALA